MTMGNKQKIISFNAEDRPSDFSIKRDGKKIVLTHGEVNAAMESLLHRISADAILFFADVHDNDALYEKRKVIEDNIVRSVLDKIPREVLEMANTAMGGEDAPSVEELFDLD